MILRRLLPLSPTQEKNCLPESHPSSQLWKFFFFFFLFFGGGGEEFGVFWWPFFFFLIKAVLFPGKSCELLSYVFTTVLTIQTKIISSSFLCCFVWDASWTKENKLAFLSEGNGLYPFKVMCPFLSTSVYFVLIFFGGQDILWENLNMGSQSRGKFFLTKAITHFNTNFL